MNIWFRMLAEAPATLQRLIARSNRISLPRCASPQVRLERLRQSLCHARTVRVTYFALAPAEQLALQDLRHIRGGLSPADLAARYGPVRPFSLIAADIAPQSISETLLLHGFLLPRPATNRHPARFTVPLEVRRWLPRPLALPDHGIAPAPPLPPALRAATTILLSCAQRPLPLRLDGQLGVESLRRLLPRLAPLSADDVSALCRFVQPLLIDLGLLAPHGTAAALAPGGARFLALPPETQLNRLRAAWVAMPRLDEWLRPLLFDTRGIDGPLLRRRLLAWAATLPLGVLLAADGLYDALAEAHGPLADAHTHGFRPVDRAPWQPKRAAAVWNAALRGPLTWLGSIAWSDEQRYCFATPIARADVADADDEQLQESRTAGFQEPRDCENHESETDAEAATQNSKPWPEPGRRLKTQNLPYAWRYGARGEVLIAHAALDAAVLRLLPYARWQQADAQTSSYRIIPRRLALARRDGFSIDALATLLERQAGPLPDEWREWLDPTASVQIIYGAVVMSEDPAVLDRAAQARSVRRHLKRLAPGIALADPKRVETLTRALGRQDLSVERRGAPEVARPRDLSAAECATLLAACACYRQHAPDGVAPDSLAALEERLRAALPFDRRIAAALAPPPVPPSPSAAADSTPRPSEAAERAEAALPDPAPAPPPAPAASVVPVQQSQGAHLGGAALAPLLAPLLALALTLFALLPLLGRRRAPHHAAPLRPPPVPAADGPLAPSAASEQSDAPDGAQVAALLPNLRQAIRRRQPLSIVYHAADGTPTTRVIRPLLLENHADCWYVQAYCLLRRDERLFRVDRIAELREVRLARRRGRPKRVEQPSPASAARPARSRTRPTPPRASFFPPPPDPPPGSPLVRVWLAD